MDYNIYCVSNSSSNTVVKNTLISFTNLFPQNLDLKNREWGNWNSVYRVTL